MVLLFRPSLLFVWALLKRIKSLLVVVVLSVWIHCQGGLLDCVVDVRYLEITLATDLEVHPALLLRIQLSVIWNSVRTV